MHGTRVLLSPLGRTTDTADDGTYQFRDVPPGTYSLIAQAPGLTASQSTVELASGATFTASLTLRVAAVRESVTVTATGREEATMTVIQSVLDLDQSQLPLRSGSSLGEVLNNQPGVAKRSSGPGSSRPVIRGFDGDRVLILEDGVRTGTLSSQSGDHGEPIDVNKLERLEVVRGPATLLYGSNAIGGVVNAISRRDVFHQHADKGVRGYATGLGGSNNAQAGGSSGFEYGAGKWEIWGSGGGQRTGAYKTQLGLVPNSQARSSQTDAGFGHYADKAFFSFNYGLTDSRYGIPYNPALSEPEIGELAMRRHNYRFTGGLKNVGFVENIQTKVNYSDYHHQEFVNGSPETKFFNKQFIYRTVFDQKKRGPLSGSFGVWGMHRDYKVVGDEQLAPPTTQNSFALFTAQNVDLDKTRLSFGARLENNRYNPRGLQPRSFTGLSAAAGLSHRLWRDGAFVANYSHSYRAPALEELYNLGPHPGNLTFEIGNTRLKNERNDGLDLSLRHQASRLRAELNFFHYRIHNFVYMAPTGRIQDGFPEANYFQENARFAGGEAKLDIAVHPNLWLNLGADAVNARLTDLKAFLPRIPPLRGRLGFDARYKGLSIKPELQLSGAQRKVFSIETPTAGYAVVNVQGSYTLARQHALHLFSAELFNAGNTLYRNHLSFLKAFAPEIGRGVRFSYTLQVF
jgi:iron complex outermembrane receptor protein